MPIIVLFYTLSLIWLYREMLRIQTKNEMFEITRPEMMNELLFAVGMAMKKVSILNLYNCIHYLFTLKGIVIRDYQIHF